MGGTSTDVLVSMDATNWNMKLARRVFGSSHQHWPSKTVAAPEAAASVDSTSQIDSWSSEAPDRIPAPRATDAADLTVTDMNLFLGKLLPDRFPFPLNSARGGNSTSSPGGSDRRIDRQSQVFAARIGRGLYPSCERQPWFGRFDRSPFHAARSAPVC